MEKTWNIEVANPSSYNRSDYVEVDLERLGVDSHLGENDLRLSHKLNNGSYEIPFQIDCVLGQDKPKRVLTFMSQDTPGGAENYLQPTASYILEVKSPQKFFAQQSAELLSVDHYYYPPDPSKGDSGVDGYNKKWDADRNVYGVKIRNGKLEIYVSLVPHPRLYTSTNFSGAITSVHLKDAPRNDFGEPDNMLSPFKESPDKLWGQLDKIVFFPLPWELEWFYEHRILGHQYELVYSNAGLMRSVVTLRVGPFKITYQGSPIFNGQKISVECFLYRIIYMYPEKSYYMEDIFVRTSEGALLSFRPYFISNVVHPESEYTDFVRLESIPDYFGFWKHFHPNLYYGYGFASDAHVRGIEYSHEEIKWRLPMNFHHRCLHYFLFNDIWDIDNRIDLYHTIGHFGWYERIFKPLRCFPVIPLELASRYCDYKKYL